ncbi:unnamed protein product, partial [Mesorhabditis belari]|uniref:Myosin motor domain-containing protein n=1 Tax=Mesorhabditis belari TaxID=2138241 RepID=A0AAF3JBP4_9BILA
MEVSSRGSTASNGFERAVWAPDSQLGYVLGDIVDIGAEMLSIKRRDNQQIIQASHDVVFPADENLEKVVDDNCSLMYLNEGTLLHNCHQRYEKKQIYTYVANILVSINPYEPQRELYSTETIASYRGKSLGQMAPHIYALTDKAYRDMRRTGEAQSLIVSGESGAGKTESQKAVLKYLCENWGKEAGPIQQRLLETNPILEAFGNAKTTRNNNSSRFGKFVEIHFNNKHLVTGGFVSHYLLEKSRICTQASNERNYHIFYQLIAGADDEMYKVFGLSSPDRFNYLKRGTLDFFVRPENEKPINKERFAAGASTSVDRIVDDAGDFANLMRCLEKCGLDRPQIMQIFGIVAAILHLGNIDFVACNDGGKEGSNLTPGSENSCGCAARLLGIDDQQLRMALTSRAMQTTRGGSKGTLYMVPLKPTEALAARDALAKAIYSRLFDWIVATINKSIPFNDSHSYIGVLDIAGFEFFTINSFEQFCINYCNEKLQNFFNERILKQEQELYEKEGLGVEKITYVDNQDCIDLFERRGTGMLDLLDEEMRLPKPLHTHFTTAVHDSNKKHFRLDAPRKSLLKEHRGMRDDDGLLVRHFAGTVCYETAQFIEKNNDALHASLEALFEASSTPLIKLLFETPQEMPATPGGSLLSTPSRAKRLVVPSVGSKFRAQLAVLLEKLSHTGTHFVRCVKPNSSMSPWCFDGSSVLSQLRCAGMGSVLRLMQNGYPSRTGFSDLYTMYASVLPPEIARLDPRLFCKCLFRVLGLDNDDFKFGMTKIFFRPAKFAEFDQLLRQDVDAMKGLVDKVKTWLHTVRWRKAQYGVWSVIKLKNKLLYRAEQVTMMQKYARGFLVRQKFLSRFAVYRKAVNLQTRGFEMKNLVSELSPTSRKAWEAEVSESEKALELLVNFCKDQNVELDRIIVDYEKGVAHVDKMISDLRGQLAADEAARLAEIERKMVEEREREEKEQQEAILKAQEVERYEAKRREMEAERVRVEAEFQKRQAEEKAREMTALAEEQEKRAREEQKRLDGLVAARLASEKGAQATMIESPAPPTIVIGSSTPSGNSSQPKRAKLDLASWKYSDLRETINTAQDADLLAACKEEFHRRLRVYNGWKQKMREWIRFDYGSMPVFSNDQAKEKPRAVPLAMKKKTEMNNNESTEASPVPKSYQANHPMHIAGPQRYFKVPLSIGRNLGSMRFEKSGAQYAPVVLSAGRDDFEMCQVPLNVTQLPTLRGAEILEDDFEAMWDHKCLKMDDKGKELCPRLIDYFGRCWEKSKTAGKRKKKITSSH